MYKLKHINLFKRFNRTTALRTLFRSLPHKDCRTLIAQFCVFAREQQRIFRICIAYDTEMAIAPLCTGKVIYRINILCNVIIYPVIVYDAGVRVICKI
jgi:hypothetical protein